MTKISELIKKIESSYRRRISEEEAAGNFIFIAKHWLDFFPSGKIFKLKFENKEHDAMIESIDCNCVAGRPHKHFHIKLKGVKLNKGDAIVITRLNGHYALRIIK